MAGKKHALGPLEEQTQRIRRDLHQLASLTRHLLEADVEIEKETVSFSQLVVLRWLDGAHPRRSGHIARFLAASEPAASQFLARLLRKGLVRTRTDPGDRRSRDLLLTAKGRRFLVAHERSTRAKIAGVFGGADAGELEALAQGLERTIEMLLREKAAGIDLCLHCSAHEAPACVMRRHGGICPVERPRRSAPTL